MKYTGYENFFGHDQSFILRVMAYLKGGKSKINRNRNNCPEWVKDAAIAKAETKREARAGKRLVAVQNGTMQMLVPSKKRKRRLFK
jgi:hypothetical protein